MSNPNGVEVGQIWQDNDKRCQTPESERLLKVLEVTDTHAKVVTVDREGRFWPTALKARMTKIRLDRFKPTTTGYRRREDLEVQR